MASEADETIQFFLLRKKKSSKTRNLVHFVNIKGKDYVFKCPTKENSDISLTNEVIASHILSAINAPTVKYQKATAKGIITKTKGNISPNFLKNGEESITLGQLDRITKMEDLYKDKHALERTFFALHPFDVLLKKHTLDEKVVILNDETEKISTLPILKHGVVSKKKNEISSYVDKIKQRNNISFIGRYIYKIEELANLIGYQIEGNIEDELIKMAVADIITGQPDRHDDNISVILNNKEKTIRIAPIYDNEFAFYTTSYETLDDVIILSQKHYEMLSDKNTEVGKYYQNIKDYLASGQLDKQIDSLKQEFQRPEGFWTRIEIIYKTGIEFIDSKIENVKTKDNGYKYKIL